MLDFYHWLTETLQRCFWQEDRQSASGEQQAFGDTPPSVCLWFLLLLSADGRQQDVFRKISRVNHLTWANTPFLCWSRPQAEEQLLQLHTAPLYLQCFFSPGSSFSLCNMQLRMVLEVNKYFALPVKGTCVWVFYPKTSRPFKQEYGGSAEPKHRTVVGSARLPISHWK